MKPKFEFHAHDDSDAGVATYATPEKEVRIESIDFKEAFAISKMVDETYAAGIVEGERRLAVLIRRMLDSSPT